MNKPERPDNRTNPSESPDTLIWGKNPVTELLRAGTGVDTLLLADSLDPRTVSYFTALGKQAGAVIKRVPSGKLQKLCGTPDHQGIAAWAARIQYAELEDLLNILSYSIGSLTNPEKLMNTFKSVKRSRISSVTIKKYLDYLEDSFLIEPAQRYDIRGKEYIETPKKYYFSDLCLRNARINFRQFEEKRSMENVIYNELRMRGYNVDVGVVKIAERNSEGKVVRKQLEMDFVCNLGSSRYYIQSAYSLPDEAKRMQEIRPFRKIDDSFKKIIVTKDLVQPYYDDYGILTVNIYDFLLDPHIIEK